MVTTLTEKRTRDRSLLPWFGGAGIGIATAAIFFWMGHQFWPPQPETLSSSGSIVTTGGPVSKSALLGLSENTIADIAAKVSDSVVNIDTSSSVTVAESPFAFGPLQGFGIFPGPGMEPFAQAPHKLEQHGTGSGVIFRSDGYIVTNNHVVGNAQDIKVTLNDKRVYSGKVVGRDSFTDLALIKIDAKNLPAAQFGTSKNLRPGDWAIAIGSPMNLDHTVTLGIISALGRSVDINRHVELIQTDAAINPGNSGGPLINIHGSVIGINVAIRGDAQNIGFSIPVDIAKDVAQQLLDRGKIGRAYLGIYMQDLDDKLAKSLGLSSTTKGVVVGKVLPGSPAETGGLLQSDVVEKIDGTPVATGKDVQSTVLKHKPGDTLNMLVLRNGAPTEIPVKLGDYPTQEQN